MKVLCVLARALVSLASVTLNRARFAAYRRVWLPKRPLPFAAVASLVVALGFAPALRSEPQARVVLDPEGNAGGKLSLEWDSAASALYDLEVSGNLSEWARVEGFPLAGDDSTMSVLIERESEALFYRLTENLGAHGPAVGLRLMSGFKYSEEARISLVFRLTNSQGEPVKLSEYGQVSIYENDKLVDPDESIIKITRNPDVDKYSLLLFDLSGSLFSNPTDFQKLRDAAEAYLRSVFADGSHYVDIGYFAGDVVTHQNTADSYYIQRNFGYQNDLETALALLDEIANTVPNDLSTNLYGALVEGHQLLQEVESHSEGATLRNLVVLTDGDDSAGVYSDEEVRELIAEQSAESNGTAFYLIRVGSSSGDETLENFEFDGLQFADDTGALEQPFADIAERMASESKGLLRVEYESAKRAGNVSGRIDIVDAESALTHPYSFDATGFQSSELRLWWHDYDNGSYTSEDMSYLVDSGIPVRYGIGRLYEDLEHVLIATDQAGKLEAVESSVARKDGYDPAYPFLAVYTGDRNYLYQDQPYLRYDRLTLEIRRKDGRVVKRSEPVPFLTGVSQRFNGGNYLHAPGMIRADTSMNLNMPANLVGPSGRYLYGVGSLPQPTGRTTQQGQTEVVWVGTGLIRYDRLTLTSDLLAPMTGNWDIIAFDEDESKILLQKQGSALDAYTYHVFELNRGRLIDLPLSSGSEGNVFYAPSPSLTGDGKKVVYEKPTYPSTIGIYDLATGEDETLDPQVIFAGHRLPTDGVFSFNRDASVFAFGTHKTSDQNVFHGIYVYDRQTGQWSEHPMGHDVEVRNLQLSADARFLFYSTSYLSSTIDTGVVTTVSGHSWRGSLLNDPDNRIYDKGDSYLDTHLVRYGQAQMCYNGTRSYSTYEYVHSEEHGIHSRGIAWLYEGEERPDDRVESYVVSVYEGGPYDTYLPWANSHRLSQLHGSMSADGRIAVLYEPETYEFFLMDGEYHLNNYDY